MRDYRPEDFDTLWSIDQSCFAPGIAYSRAELYAYMRRSGAFTVVAEADGLVSERVGAILGFLVAENSRRGMGHIITIDVRVEARRHRVGSALLDAAEARLRDAKSHSVYLETAVDNISALSFYKRHEYLVVKVVPHYYSNGVDALLLAKNLLSVKSAS